MEHSLSNKAEAKYAGFEPKWIGPFTVIAARPSDVYKIWDEVNDEVKTVHFDQMKKYHEGNCA